MDGVPRWNNIVVFANYVNTTTTKELTTAVFAVYSGRYSIALWHACDVGNMHISWFLCVSNVVKVQGQFSLRRQATRFMIWACWYHYGQ